MVLFLFFYVLSTRIAISDKLWSNLESSKFHLDPEGERRVHVRLQNAGTLAEPKGNDMRTLIYEPDFESIGASWV